MKSLSTFAAAAALVMGAAWVAGCSQRCPASGCGTDQRCGHTVDTGTYCCTAPGVKAQAEMCCAPPDAGTSVCGCIPNYGIECTKDADCCSGHCAPVAGSPTVRGWCVTPDGGTP